MKKFKVKIWGRDPHARLWRLTALSCFCLRYSKGLIAATFPKPASSLEKAMDNFRRYGEELEILEHDLTECINELQMAHERYYSDPEFLELKKFAIVYHIDNFYVRVHKLIEDIYGLLALAVGLERRAITQGGSTEQSEQAESPEDFRYPSGA